MGEESYFVRTHMNSFSQQIVASGIDVHVIILAMLPPFPCIGPICPPGICIDPPLGAGGCPAPDTKLPNYLHVYEAVVGSHDAYSVILDHYNAYKGQLRPGANKALVIITDDNAAAPYVDDGNAFLQQFKALDPALLGGIVVHGIYCFDAKDPCVAKGTAYEQAINATGGIHGDLSQQDFKPIFDEISKQIVISAGVLPCEYVIPPPPPAETFDKDKVNVEFTDGNGNPSTIYHVDDVQHCSTMTGGWYYDDNQSPNSIILCPTSCDTVSGDPMGKIDILLGCATLLPPPE